MIDKIEFINIFNPESYNTVKTLPTFKKRIPNKINVEKNIKYIYKKFNSINLLDYFIRSKETSRSIHAIAYSNVIAKILTGIYLNKNFTIDVIKDRKIIYLNEHEDINNNEFIIDNLKKQEIFRNSLLNNNKNVRYGLSKVRLGDYNIVVAGKIDATMFNNNINIILVRKLTYKILLELYINGIITKTYKVLYAIINKDNNIRYYNSIKITEIADMLSLDTNKGIVFFNKVINKIKLHKTHKFKLSYNAINKEFIME
jgi:hypothetical protein